MTKLVLLEDLEERVVLLEKVVIRLAKLTNLNDHLIVNRPLADNDNIDNNERPQRNFSKIETTRREATSSSSRKLKQRLTSCPAAIIDDEEEDFMFANDLLNDDDDSMSDTDIIVKMEPEFYERETRDNNEDGGYSNHVDFKDEAMERSPSPLATYDDSGDEDYIPPPPKRKSQQSQSKNYNDPIIPNSSEDDDEIHEYFSSKPAPRRHKQKRLKGKRWETLEKISVPPISDLPPQPPYVRLRILSKLEILNLMAGESLESLQNLPLPLVEEETSHTFSCFKCPNLVFENLEEQKTHLRTHDDYCKECNRYFTTRSSYGHHLRKLHPDQLEQQKITCPDCQLEFQHKSTYDVHKAVHTDEKTIMCNVCGKYVKTKLALNLHMKHIHEKPNDRPFQCEQCGASFQRIGSLTVHLKTVHAPEKHLPCQLCTVRFSCPQAVRKHMKRVHNQPIVIKCQVCGTIFKREMQLTRHMKFVHGQNEGHDKEKVPLGNDISENENISRPSLSLETTTEQRHAIVDENQ